MHGLATTAKVKSLQGGVLRPRTKNRGNLNDLPFELRSIGVGNPLLANGETEGSFAIITCCSCPNHAKIRIPDRVLPEKIVTKFEKSVDSGGFGWKCESKTQRRWCCPFCLASREQTRRGESPKGRLAVVSKPKPAPIVDLPRRKCREIMRAMEVVWDWTDQEYMLGWSDKKIAEACGVTEVDVQRVRTFSPEKLAEEDSFDAEAAAVAEQTNKFRAKLDNVLNQVSEIETELSDLVQRQKLLEKRYKPEIQVIEAAALPTS